MMIMTTSRWTTIPLPRLSLPAAAIAGCAYALDGKIKKIAISTYLITPYNVDVVGDLVEELENNGMYF